MLKKRIDSKQRELSAASQRFKCAWQVWETGQWRPSGAVSQSVEYEVEVRRSAEDRQGQAPGLREERWLFFQEQWVAIEGL